MELPGYKLVMNKFRLVIRKFLIIRGMKFWKRPDRRGRDYSAAPLQRNVGQEGGILKREGLVCPMFQDLLPLGSGRKYVFPRSLRGSISPSSFFCISAALLMIQNNSPGAKLLAGFESKRVPNQSERDIEGNGQGAFSSTPIPAVVGAGELEKEGPNSCPLPSQHLPLALSGPQAGVRCAAG